MGLLNRKRLRIIEQRLGNVDTSGVDLPAGSIGATEIGGDILTGAHAAEVVNVNVAGGLPVMHRILLASGADANVDVALTEKTRVVDMTVVLKGAGTAGCIVAAQNVTTAITESIDLSAGSDKDLFRAGTIDDAQHEIAAGANLRIAYASTGGDFPGAEVYVLGFKVA